MSTVGKESSGTEGKGSWGFTHILILVSGGRSP